MRTTGKENTPFVAEAWFIWPDESVSVVWLNEQEREDSDPRTR